MENREEYEGQGEFFDYILLIANSREECQVQIPGVKHAYIFNDCSD
jgi:hypothetical protein